MDICSTPPEKYQPLPKKSQPPLKTYQPLLKNDNPSQKNLKPSRNNSTPPEKKCQPPPPHVRTCPFSILIALTCSLSVCEIKYRQVKREETKQIDTLWLERCHNSDKDEKITKTRLSMQLPIFCS